VVEEERVDGGNGIERMTPLMNTMTGSQLGTTVGDESKWGPRGLHNSKSHACHETKTVKDSNYLVARVLCAHIPPNAGLMVKS